MNFPRWVPRLAAATTGLALAATLPASLGVPSAAGTTISAPIPPIVKLIRTQKIVTVTRFGKNVFVDPGVYVASLEAPLVFKVWRDSYVKPLQIAQVVKAPGGGTTLEPLPSSLLDGWNGLHRFLRMTVKNSHGKTVGARVMPFCPNSFNVQRATPDSAANSPFPQSCFSNPFTLGMVWGLQRGWGTDAAGGGGFFFPGEPSSRGPIFKLGLGTYHVTLTITARWQRLLHISASDAHTAVTVKVVKGRGCLDVCPPQPRKAAVVLPKLPANVPTLASPPASTLPDLVPLPSWMIGVQNHKATAKHPTQSFLDFGATVWIGGHGPLDVEGFRSPHRSLMRAYQYFTEHGKVVGRVRVGTMGFDNKKGHHHWHFEQFGQYRLLNASKSTVLRSQKVGFCIAPTDPINLLLPHATWQPNQTGLFGECGSPNSLWVREMLPEGWGDTYVQFIAGQSFNISNLPNGTYYIEIIANPEHVLRESNYRNDVSLRKVIIGGTSGHKTVRVPAVHGIDPAG